MLTNKRGATLIELMLYVAIAAILLLSVTGTIFTLLRTQQRNMTVAEIDQQAAIALQSMLQDVRNAEAILSPTGSSDTLSLAMPAAAEDPSSYTVTDGALVVERGGGAAVALTNDDVEITAFTVENLSYGDTPGTVRITISITSSSLSARYAYDVTKTYVSSGTLR